MADYYDVDPIRVPRIPIALIGFFGSEVDTVALKLGALTGLAVQDVGRLMVHDAGGSPAKIFLDLGPEEYRRVAKRSLERAVRSTPPGVVSLPFDILRDDAERELILRDTALVYVDLEYDAMVRKVTTILEGRPGAFFPWISPDRLVSVDLERLFAEHRPSYDAAMLHIDATGRTPTEVARDVIERFELWESEDDAPA